MQPPSDVVQISIGSPATLVAVVANRLEVVQIGNGFHVVVTWSQSVTVTGVQPVRA